MTLERAAFRHSRNYHLAQLTEVLAPAMKAAARVRCGPTSAPSAWRKGLILSHTHIGDALWRSASLPHLKRALPDCEWCYLCSEESASVLSGRDDVSEVLPLLTGDGSWTLKRGGFKTLGAFDFDVALCTNTLKQYEDLMLSVALGIPNRVAYDYKGLSGLMTIPIKIDYPSPFPAYFRTMVSSIGGVAPEWDLRPKISITPDEIRIADEFLSGLTLNGSPLVACCPTTRQAVGAWPPEQLLAAAETAAREIGARLILCGGPSDKRVLESLAAKATIPCDVAAGALPIKAFAAFLSRCAVVLTQDSAPRHLANAVGTSVVFTSNLSVSRIQTGAYCDTEIDAAPSDEFVGEDQYAAVVAKRPPEEIASLAIQVVRMSRS